MQSPARYNADKKGFMKHQMQKTCSFAESRYFLGGKNEIIFFLSSNSPDDLTLFRRKVLKEVKDLPIYAEYMHRDAIIYQKIWKRCVLINILFILHDAAFYKVKSKEKYFVIQNYFLVIHSIIFYIFLLN